MRKAAQALQPVHPAGEHSLHSRATGSKPLLLIWRHQEPHLCNALFSVTSLIRRYTGICAALKALSFNVPIPTLGTDVHIGPHQAVAMTET